MRRRTVSLAFLLYPIRPIFAIALLACWLGCAGCAADHSHSISGLRTQLGRAAIVFFVDGMDQPRLDAMLAAGELPNIDARFVRGGVRVRRAVSCIPALTYPNSASIMTGCFPGHHGIVGNQWFDRVSLVMPNYIRPAHYRDVNEHFVGSTIHEILSDCLSVNIQCHTRRGVSQTIDNEITTALAFSVGPISMIDRCVGRRMKEVVALARRAGAWPTLMVTYFPGVDEAGHLHGPDSPQYAAALRTVDTAIGTFLADLSAAGFDEPLYAVLCSDHNHVAVPAGRSWSIDRWLRARGRSVYTRPIDDADFLARARRLEPFDTVLAADAYRAASIYLRRAGGWSSKPTHADQKLIAQLAVELCSVPAVELVLTRDQPAAARVYSPHGTARFERETVGGVSKYRVVDLAGDPMRAAETPAFAAFINEGWHTSREWLTASAVAVYPDLAPQAVDLFDSQRTGDILVFAAGNWAFGEASRGEHGSCLARDRVAPLYFCGPGMPAGGEIPAARLVDVMPTVVDLLGRAERLSTVAPLDGVSIRTELERAVAPAMSAESSQSQPPR